MRRIARSLVVVLLFGFYQYAAPYSAIALNAQPPSSNLTVGTGACSSTVTDNSTSAVEEVTVANYCVLKFKSGNNSWTAPAGVNNIWLLVVGGGGTGGYGRGGGGGGGGMYENTNFTVSNQSYSITVAATKNSGASFSGAGNQSVFGDLTVNGGGGGGSHLDPTPVPFTTSGTPNALTGASGGGSGMNYVNYSNGGGTASVIAQTNVSANSGANSGSTGNSERNTGGGGGAGGAGVSGSGGTTSATGGTSPNGGAGKASSITGTSTFYAAGGGGASGITGAEYAGSYTTALAGTGGSSIGGNGERVTALNTSTAATSGTANTGSGGGGGVSAGGNGASGVVIIRWIPVAQTTSPASVSIPDSHTITLSYFETTTTGLTVTRQWQSSTNGTSWSNVSGGSGANTDTYTTTTLYLSQTGIQFRGSTTFSDGTLSSTRYTSAATITIFTPPGSDTDTALLSSATSGYAWTKDNAALDISSAITLEAWVYPTAFTQSAWNVVINKGASYEIGITSTNGTTGTWNYAFASTSSGLTTSVNTAIPVALNEWHHVAVTRGANLATADFYLDGVKVYSGTADGASTSGLYNSAFPLAIGARTSDGVTFTGQFKGQIDHAMVFNSARTAAEVLADMNSYSVSNSTELRAYFDFNEGSGTSIYNRVIGSPAETTLTSVSSQSWPEVKITDTTTLPAYTIVKFPRTYLTSIGGWRVPDGIPKVSAMVVAGGGAGGSRVGGGGGAGGYVYRGVVTLTGNTIESITVGQGGVGIPNYAGKNGGNSSLGSKMIAIGGGGGGASNDNSERAGRNGGSGGGTGDATGFGTSTQTTSGSNDGLGFSGARGQAGGSWSAGGGGGATSAGFAGDGLLGTNDGRGGSGKIETITGTATCYAAGGGGGIYAGSGSEAFRSNPGLCTGAVTTSGAGAAGLKRGANATSNTGSGGGGAGYQTPSTGSDLAGGNGGSGIIVIRWITALKPTYTKPANTTLDVGQTETFTTNVVDDSATVNLIRTFTWESSTNGTAGPFTLIKQGTGAAFASFSWVPTDASTSGSNYLYRLTVTDSDTAGLFISDSSTAYATINEAMIVGIASGGSVVGKTINVSRNENIMISFGTSTYRSSMSPFIQGITLDTSTASSPVLKISDTLTVGTYYETITVVDSVSATFTFPLTIVVAAPPNLLNTGEIVSNNLKLHLEPGNSKSLILPDSATATSAIWRDLSGNGKDAQTSGTFESGGYAKTCSAPQYSSYNGGYLKFNGSNTCYMTPYLGEQFDLNLSVEVWVRVDGAMSASTIVQQNYTTSPGSPVPNVNYILGDTSSDGTIRFGIYDGSYRQTAGVTPTLNTWMHLVGTYDGNNFRMYKDGGLFSTSIAFTGGLGNGINLSGTLIGRRGSSADFFNGAIGLIRIYNKALTAAQVSQNFNATKYRFLSANFDLLSPSQKYGNRLTETYTATSGYGSDSITFATGIKPGLDLTTLDSVTTLTLQESLTATTHYETITVTDSLGASTFLPIKMTVSKADTLTISMDTKTVVTYNGSPITSYPKPIIKGLAGLDTITVTTKFSSSLYTKSATVPTNSDTYTVIAEDPVFGIGALSNYVNVVYETSTAVVNKAKQPALSVFLYGGTVGLPFPITVSGGGGDGAISETVTAGSSMTGCAITNHSVSASSTSQGFCRVYIFKAASQNYLSESITVDMYFMAYINNQPTGQVGSGSTIAINGVTSFETSTVTPPGVTSLSSTTISLAALGEFTINGSDFDAGGLTVKFYRNKTVPIKSSTASTITFDVSAIRDALATSGRIVVITVNGEAVSPQSLTITP